MPVPLTEVMAISFQYFMSRGANLVSPVPYCLYPKAELAYSFLYCLPHKQMIQPVLSFTVYRKNRWSSQFCPVLSAANSSFSQFHPVLSAAWTDDAASSILYSVYCLLHEQMIQPVPSLHCLPRMNRWSCQFHSLLSTSWKDHSACFVRTDDSASFVLFCVNHISFLYFVYHFLPRLYCV